MKKLYENEASDELRARGINSSSLGTHSVRKGAASYCASGSTSCPSIAAINLRAGWTMGGVQDTYLRYEGAGDAFVGRTVAGLSVTSERFGILPPFFPSRDAYIDDVRKLVIICLYEISPLFRPLIHVFLVFKIK